jgi:hypothetical protein
MVARKGGARFIPRWDYWLHPDAGISEEIARQALDDVANWLGLTRAEYLALLSIERKDIFKRAQWRESAGRVRRGRPYDRVYPD